MHSEIFRESTETNFLKWFFFFAPRDILVAGRNFGTWAWQFFSIGYLPPRLFAPWHKDISSYGRGFDLKRFLHVIGWNLISRVIGAILRVCVVGIGLLVEGFILVSTLLIFAIWTLLPILIILLITSGILSLI